MMVHCGVSAALSGNLSTTYTDTFEALSDCVASENPLAPEPLDPETAAKPATINSPVPPTETLPAENVLPVPLLDVGVPSALGVPVLELYSSVAIPIAFAPLGVIVTVFAPLDPAMHENMVTLRLPALALPCCHVLPSVSLIEGLSAVPLCVATTTSRLPLVTLEPYARLRAEELEAKLLELACTRVHDTGHLTPQSCFLRPLIASAWRAKLWPSSRSAFTCERLA